MLGKNYQSRKHIEIYVVSLTIKTKWNFVREGKEKNCDLSTRSTVQYPAPQGPFWACSDGKFYFTLNSSLKLFTYA